MKHSQAQIKTEMMKRIEKEFDELLNWREGSYPPTLSQLEEEVLSARKGMSQAPVKVPECPKCQVMMENKGKRDKVIETRLGRCGCAGNITSARNAGKAFSPG